MPEKDHAIAQVKALEQLLTLFGSVKAAIVQTLSDQARTPPMGLRMLQLCARQPGITPQALAEGSGRDKAQITRLVKMLLEEGLLERQPHPQDKRSYSLWLTPQGQQALHTFEHAQALVASQLFGELSAAQLQAQTAQWAALNTRLSDVMQMTAHVNRA
ncbi:MAG: MarR family winged helix-turn-helix transcriptional regulator [Aquabacterium sp.]|uniref:MarR family winged helix-turn-helix transcriptional regulator n=1 Tax=Aquabacterium sp. TaxID=1872578 RepID=UPI003BD7C83C